MKSYDIKSALREGYYVVSALIFRTVVFLARKVFRKRLLLFERPAGVGDIICSFPAVLALREKFPDALIIYSVHWHFRQIVEMGQVADYIVGCESSPIFPKIVRADFDYYFLPRLADESDRPEDSVHLVDDYCKLTGVVPKSRQPRLIVREEARAKAKERLQKYRSKAKVLLGFHPGRTWPVREWNDEGWTRLVEMLHQNYDCTVLQFGTDVHASARIPGAVDCVGEFDLPEVTAIIEQLDLFIGIDSGLLHIAGGVGTPTVALFGAVDPKKRLGCDTPSIAVMADVPCLGCHHRQPRLHWEENCSNEIVCMKNISPEMVFGAVGEMLASKEPVNLKSR
jgi:ADP-heptose:LPS heptosyltransferase